MASITVNGRKVLKGSVADPESNKFRRESGGRSVVLADGTQLNAKQSKAYGRTPTVFTNTNLLENKIPEMESKVANLPIYTPSNQQQNEQDEDIDSMLGLGGKKEDKWTKLRQRQSDRAAGTIDDGSDPYQDQAMELLNQMKETSDQGTRDQIALIEQQANRLRAKTASATAAGVQGVRTALLGTGAYRTGSGIAAVRGAEMAGIEQLADIDAKEREAVAAARLAQQNGDYKLLGEKLDVLETIRKDKAKVSEDTLKAQRQSLRDNQIAELVGGGLTDPIKLLQKLNAASGDFTIDEIENVLGAITKSDDPADDLLSPTEAAKLGVPFGTTKREAFGKIPQSSNLDDLSPAQQSAMFKLADDYNAASKDFFAMQGAFEKIKAAQANPSAAADLALIFSFMKMLDPTSVVREQEFANAQNAAGVPERIRAQYNKILNGERLTDTTRADFVTQAKSQFEAAKGTQKRNNDIYGSRAEKLGIPRDYVVQDINEIDSRTADEKLQELYNDSPENKALIDDILTNEPDVTSEELLNLIENGPISMQAERLADSIAMVESGNKQVAGASGEFGAFQFMPSTWAAISKEVSGKLLPQTPANERMVASKKIEKLLAAGNTPEEVALIWNTSLGGTEEPRRIRGTNDKGVDYDSVAYAKKVLAAFNA